MELVQVAVDELYRRHERIAELRRKVQRTEEEEEEVRLLYDRTMPLLRRTGKPDLLALAREGERALGRYLAWDEDGMGPFELVRERR